MVIKYNKDMKLLTNFFDDNMNNIIDEYVSMASKKKHNLVFDNDLQTYRFAIEDWFMIQNETKKGTTHIKICINSSDSPLIHLKPIK